jgi:hypothetical protein
MALDGSSLTGVAPTKATIDALGIAASSITGALPAIDGSNLTNMAAGGKLVGFSQVDCTGQSGVSGSTSTTLINTGLTFTYTYTTTGSKLACIHNTRAEMWDAVGAWLWLELKKGSTSMWQSNTMNQNDWYGYKQGIFEDTDTSHVAGDTVAYDIWAKVNTSSMRFQVTGGVGTRLQVFEIL